MRDPQDWCGNQAWCLPWPLGAPSGDHEGQEGRAQGDCHDHDHAPLLLHRETSSHHSLVFYIRTYADHNFICQVHCIFI